MTSSIIHQINVMDTIVLYFIFFFMAEG